MSWAAPHIAKLAKGETIQFRPSGNSMEPRIPNRALVTVAPARNFEGFRKGDIVLCRVKGRYYLHFIQAVQQKMNATLYQIGNASGHTNGWTSQIYGKVTRVEK